MNQSHVFCIAVCFSMLFGGCAVVETNLAVDVCETKGKCESDNFQAPNGGKGIVYYLPKRLMRLTAERTATPTPTVVTARAALRMATNNSNTATTAARVAAQALTNAQNELELANSPSTPVPTGQDIARLNSIILTTSIALQRSNQSRDTAQVAVVSASAALDAALAGKKMPNQVSILLELLPAEANPSQVFYARPRHLNPFRDDTTEIEINERGLLTSSTVVATDRTADVLAEIAGIAGLIFNPGSLGTVTNAGIEPTSRKKSGCPDLPSRFEKIFDPLSDKQMKNTNMVLEECFQRKIVITTVDGEDAQFTTDNKPSVRLQTTHEPGLSSFERKIAISNAEKTQLIKSQYKGYVYRANIPYIVTVNRINESQNTFGVAEESVIAMLPNRGPIGYIPIKSSFLVRTASDVTFRDGGIAAWERERPSEVLAFVRVPVALAREFLSIPTELIQLRVNLENQEANLLAAQRAQIEANEALRALHDCVVQAGSSGQSPSSCVASSQ